MARKEGTTMSEAVATPEAPAASAAPRVATRYTRTDKALAKEIRGQAKETLDVFDNAGGNSLSVAEVAAKCAYTGSRQDKERVAGFYIARFKKEGLIAPVQAPAA